MPRRQPGRILGGLRQHAFTIRQHRAGLTRRLGRLGQPVIMPVMGALQLLDLPVQPADHVARVAVQPGLAFGITVQLGNPAPQRVDQLPRPRLLIAQRVALHHQPLQDRCRPS